MTRMVSTDLVNVFSQQVGLMAFGFDHGLSRLGGVLLPPTFLVMYVTVVQPAYAGSSFVQYWRGGWLLWRQLMLSFDAALSIIASSSSSSFGGDAAAGIGWCSEARAVLSLRVLS